MSEKEVFWQNFFASTSLTPSLDVNLIGESGITHKFPAIGTGDAGQDGRMVLITSEPDPIKAQLIAFDIQKKYSSEKVILARPNIADTKQIVSRFAMKLFELKGQGNFQVRLDEGLQVFTREKLEAEGILEASKGTIVEEEVRSIFFGKTILDASIFESVVQFVRECILLEVHSMVQEDSFDFSALLKRSAYSPETLEGICAIPIFELLEEDWKVLTEKVDHQGSLALLKRLGVQQFFEPPVDQVALVLGENSKLSSSTLKTTLGALDRVGHRVTSPELISAPANIDDLIEHLLDKKYVVDGEYELKLSEIGKEERLLVKFRPREAVFYKLLKAIPGVAQLIGSLK